MVTRRRPISPERQHILHDTLRWIIPGVMMFLYFWAGYKRYVPPLVSVVHVTIFCLLCGWGIWKIVRRERLARSPLTWPLLALLGSTTLSTIFSVSMRSSFDGLVMILTLVLVCFLITDLLANGWQPVYLVRSLLVAASLLLIIGSINIGDYMHEWWQVRTASYTPLLFTYRLFGVTDHPNTLAGQLTMFLPFAIVALAQSQRGAVRIAWAGWLGWFVVIFFFTGSRGGTMGAGVATAITVTWLLLRHGWPQWGKIHLWVRQTAPVWGATLCYIGLFLILTFYPTIQARFSSLYTGSPVPTTTSTFSANSGDVTQSASGRMSFWAVAWREFLAHPATGSGPLTFGRAFVRDEPGVRYWVSIHPHNLFFDMLGNQGLAGVLALAWMILTGFVLFARGLWNTIPPDSALNNEEASLLVAATAALSGFLTHSLVDVTGITTFLLVVLITPIGLHAAGAVRQDQRPLSRWSALVLAAPLLLAVILVRYNRAQEAMFQAVQYGVKGDWAAAAHAMDAAVENDPSFAFYHGQRGYAYSYLAAPVNGEGDPAALKSALESYTLSRELEPPYVPNLLNMAALLEQAGQPQQVEQILEATVKLPQTLQWALPHLLLAERYAAQGRGAEADTLFTTAFKAEPHAPAMAACQMSETCRVAAQRLITPTLIATTHERVHLLLAQGEPQQALELLKQVPENNKSPLPWLDRANAHLAFGQVAEGTYALAVADTLRSTGTSPETDAYNGLTHAAYAQAQGQTTQVIADLEGAVKPTVKLRYSYALYRRIGLPGDLQPRLDLLQSTADDLAVYRQLATLYEQQGRTTDAAWAQERADLLAFWLATDEQTEP